MTAGNLFWKPSGNLFLRHWNCLQWKKQAVPAIGRKFNRLALGFPGFVFAAFRIGAETVRSPLEATDTMLGE